MTKIMTKEGFISFRGYNVWYRIVGDREKPNKMEFKYVR